MELYSDKNWDYFLKILPAIRSEIDDWKLVHFQVGETGGEDVSDIAKKLCDALSAWQGAAFVYNSTEILMLAKLGKVLDVEHFKSSMSKDFATYKCSIQTKSISVDGLARIEIALSMRHSAPPSIDNNTSKISLLDQRKKRKDNIIMIVDDDMFMRSLIAKVTRELGQVVELSDGTDFLQEYMKVLPDIVFLDIHMPAGSGLDFLSAILEKDPDAYIVILSADSVGENVVEAKARGAKWFLAKPFTKEKIISAIGKCSSLNQHFAN